MNQASEPRSVWGDVVVAVAELVRLHPDLPMASVHVSRYAGETKHEVAIHVGRPDGVVGVCQWAIRCETPVRFTRYLHSEDKCELSTPLPLGGPTAHVWAGVTVDDGHELLSSVGGGFDTDLDPRDLLAALDDQAGGA